MVGLYAVQEKLLNCSVASVGRAEASNINRRKHVYFILYTSDARIFKACRDARSAAANQHPAILLL